MNKSYFLLSILSFALLSMACQQGSYDAPNPGETAPSPTAESSTTKAPGMDSEAGSAEEVKYEPAYPADVSTEELSEEDVAQQETQHSHDGGEMHSHDAEPGHHEDSADGHHDH
ncbi:MAG: hypothetical protein K0U98_07880 [Deltaproteobacteria bacterium]|nr:hypothetical protein [Deltaproteobacteria bacterium]